MEFHITGFIHTVHVTEAGSDGKVRADLYKSAIDVVNIFGLGVKRIVVNVLVVYTVLLSSGDTDFLLS